MKDKIESVFNALQELSIPATPRNVSIMDNVYEMLRTIYKELEVSENGRKDGTAVDSYGRNDH